MCCKKRERERERKRERKSEREREREKGKKRKVTPSMSELSEVTARAKRAVNGVFFFFFRFCLLSLSFCETQMYNVLFTMKSK